MASTVVADIGGTSSRWGALREGQEALVFDGLPGFNPAVGEPDAFVEEVRERFRREGIGIDDLFAYGAGCGSLERSTRMAETLLTIFPQARVDVASDLMGAAHGLLGDRSGLVLILGTGMNAGWYDGTALHQPMPSLGYILGDEGSGADIGEHLVRDALHGRLPDEVMELVFPGGPDVAEVVKELYRGSSPQAWLAGFVGKLAPSFAHPYVQELVAGRFRTLARLLSGYFSEEQRADVFATGSVAFGLNGPLRMALAEEGMRLNEVQRSPLPGLLRYRAALAR
jgi:glucosamine kinase